MPMYFLLLIIVCGYCNSFKSLLGHRRANSLRMVAHPSARRIAYELGKLDIRVGKILSCKVMESNKAYFISSVDVGESMPRTIMSRMTHLIKRDRFFKKDANNVVCCNTQPVEIDGVISRGNFFFSQNFYNQCALLDANDNPGSRVSIQGVPYIPVPPSVEANCAYVLVKPYLSVGDDGAAMLDPDWLQLGGKQNGKWATDNDYVRSDIVGNIVLSPT